MDHTIENLDDCVFDYLASKPNTFVSIRTIYRNIMGNTGHRCSALTDSIEDRKYFSSVCYGINNYFTNIVKRHKSGLLFLSFEKNGDIDNINNIDTEADPYNLNIDSTINNLNLDGVTDAPWCDIDAKTVVQYICDKYIYREYESSYFSRPYTREPLIHEMIRYANTDEVMFLFQDTCFNIDYDCVNKENETPLDIAIQVGNKRIVTYLADREVERKKVSNKVRDYDSVIDDWIQYGSKHVMNTRVANNSTELLDVVSMKRNRDVAKNGILMHIVQENKRKEELAEREKIDAQFRDDIYSLKVDMAYEIKRNDVIQKYFTCCDVVIIGVISSFIAYAGYNYVMMMF